MKKNSCTSILLAGTSLLITSLSANANILNATSGGTFRFNFDRDAIALYGTSDTDEQGNPIPNSIEHPGYFISKFSNTANSDYLSKTSGYFINNSGDMEISAVNLIHDITSIGSNPTGQATGRFVKGTTPNFAIDSDTLAGTGSMGLTGVQAFTLPFYGDTGGTLIYGDFTLKYSAFSRAAAWDDAGVPGTPSGWYLRNNISFSATAYDLANLTVNYDDAENWELKGDLLIAPENATFLLGAASADWGDFCLGVGSHAGCGAVSAVPVPAAVWLFGTGLMGLLTVSRRK